MRLEISLESGEQSLDVRRVVANESLSSLFRISVWARSRNPSLDLTTIIGRAAAVAVESPVQDALAPRRTWSGMVATVEQVKAEPTGLSMYRLEIVPTLWRATQRSGHRIFQHLSIPEIVTQLLDEWKISPTAWEIDPGQYPKLEFKVQYGESDYAFICRLLEEAGITFLFEENEGVTSLVLTDVPHARSRRLTPVPYFQNASQSGKTEHVQELKLAKDLRSNALVLFDYDFRRAQSIRAKATQATDDEPAEQAHYQPGSFLAERGTGGNTPNADDKGIARHHDGYGGERATRLLAGARSGQAAVTLLTNAIDLRAGNIFEVSRHAHSEVDNRPLLATDYALEGAIEEEIFRIALRALPADVPYVPAVVTKKPLVHGVQSAVVVGHVGANDAEEIHVDEFGRVRVQFPWDREGKSDDDASCWVRVSQAWAGRGYGMIQLPRVGQEVLITFLNGDPDQPVVSGRLFDTLNPVPYKLPENKTISAYRSNSSPRAGGFNEIRFEDKKGSELVHLTAEKDQRALTKHNETHTVLNNRFKSIGHNELDTTGVNRTEVTGIDRSEMVGRTRTTHVVLNRAKRVQRHKGVRNEGNRRTLTHKTEDRVVRADKREWLQRESHLYVKGDLREAVDDKRSLIIDDEAHVKVGGSFAESSGNKSSYHADNKLVGEAGSAVAMRGAGGFLAIDAGGVVIQGTLVRINAGGSAGTSQQARPTPPLVAREILRIEMPEEAKDGGLDENWRGYERTFAAVTQLRAAKAGLLGAVGLREFNFAGRLIQQRDSLINLALSDKLGRSNLDRMRAGLAPLASSGLPVRLVQSAAGSNAPLLETAAAVTQDISAITRFTPQAAAGAAAAGAASAPWQPAYWRARADGLAPPPREGAT